jgi:hypothetical protein
MMRRFLLTLTLTNVFAWAQPAQQQAPTPIVVQVQVPPESVLTALLKLAIPAILAAGVGAGLTLYGVRQTNKHNAAENTANREHQLQVEIAKAEIAAKHRSQDNRWEFRKDVYTKLITLTTEMLRHLRAAGLQRRRIKQLSQVEDADSETVTTLRNNMNFHGNQAIALHAEYDIYINLAPLATADDILPLVLNVREKTREIESPASPEFLQALTDFIQSLQAAGRKDLWDTPEAEARADAVKQS